MLREVTYNPLPILGSLATTDPTPTQAMYAAARTMGMSYRRAWQLVEALNAAYRKPVVTTAIGGERGGGARVTPYGRRLAGQFRAMEGKASAAIAADLRRFARQLR